MISPDKNIKQKGEGEPLNTVNLSIPIKVKVSLWFRFKSVGWLIICLWFSLIVLNAIETNSKGEVSFQFLIGQAILSGLTTILIIAVNKST